MTKIKEVVQFLNQIAPPSLQEDYDNAGLITGQIDTNITGIVIALDCTEEVVLEAIELGCNMVIAHHPIVFRGLKRFNGSNYIEKTIITAIKNDIAIFAIHTNLDNVHNGVNHMFAQKIGLKNLKILAPKPQTLNKITFFVPKPNLEEVCNAMHDAGSGNIGNYAQCSFRIDGQGTFTPKLGAQPHTGILGYKSYEDEVRVEMIMPTYVTNSVISAMKSTHPYEEVAYFIQSLLNDNQEIGAGMWGELDNPMEYGAFFDMIKDKMGLKVIKHTAIVKNVVSKVALCGGSGSFLLKNALSVGADVYISADFKYHEFFDANGKIIIVDIGHYESEKYTIDLLFSLISNNFSNFALHCTKVDTNPINFY
jgi:dinuclear metal center YbgI/SA1388 family protein